jgi:EAL domain-containing protein (putative c-di-GMP-specific phosphodiesterase class I)/DNA-binding NarL/FixJ family response regulator
MNPVDSVLPETSEPTAADFEAACRAGAWRVVYQPIVCLQTGRAAGAEALLRWQHPQRGLLQPAAFIEALERSPWIEEVTLWVVQQALADLSRWQQDCQHRLRVAVNVPVPLFEFDRLGLTLVQTLEQHELSPLQLELELNERSLGGASASAIRRIEELRRRGVQIAIDDFGTCASSLDDVSRLPVDTLKVDLRFVQAALQRRADAAICRTIVELARSIGARSVAEGIETPGQLAFVRSIGCTEAQGWHLGRPTVAAELPAALGRAAMQVPTTARVSSTREVLFIDDEDNVLRALRRSLRGSPMVVHTATDPTQAFELLAQHRIGVVVADQRMPSMTGSDFLGRVRQLYPHTRRIVLSGYTDLQSVTDAINRGCISKFLTKPWTDVELLQALESAFADVETVRENERLRAELAQSNQRLAEALDAQGQRLNLGEQALRLLQQALGSLPVPVLGIDGQGRLTMVNEAADALLGHSEMQLGEPAPAWLHETALHAGSALVCRTPDGRRHRAHVHRLDAVDVSRGVVVTVLPEAA